MYLLNYVREYRVLFYEQTYFLHMVSGAEHNVYNVLMLGYCRLKE
jgi:hypothetical protein